MITLPNLITFGRIFLIFVLVISFYIPHNIGRWIAVIAFITGSLTDYLDGYVARQWSQVSRFGEFLDPVADKLLVATTLLMLTGFDKLNSYDLIPANLILCREIFISSLRGFLGYENRQINVSFLAKWKTFSQMIALSFLLAGNLETSTQILILIGEFLLWIAASLSMLTGYQYVKANLKYIQ